MNSRCSLVFASLPLILLSFTQSQPAPPSTVNYVIIVDCGSTGNVAWVFNWTSVTTDKPPVVKFIASAKSSTPLGDQTTLAVNIADILGSLVANVTQYVPQNMRSKTPIFIYATGVFRLLPEDLATQLENSMRQFLKNTAVNPFQVTSDRNARIITGEEEATMNYLSVMYELMSGQSTTDTKQYGILSLGGASAHIAFMPTVSILGGKQTISVMGTPYSFYAASYEHYGQNFIDLAVRTKLAKDLPNKTAVPNPCYLKGENQTVGGKTFTGTGNSSACAAIYEEFMYKDDNTSMLVYPRPFGIGYKYQPPIPTTTSFYLLDTFYKSLNTLKQPTSGSIKLDQLYANVTALCSKSMDDIKATLQQTVSIQQYISISCQTIIYMRTLLVIGYGFPEDTDNLMPANSINGMSTDYALGGLLYEGSLMMPPPMPSPQPPPTAGPPIGRPTATGPPTGGQPSTGPTTGGTCASEGVRREPATRVLILNVLSAVIIVSKMFIGQQ